MTAKPNDDILTCWQEIADYLERSVRTCQRWARHSGLPVSYPAGPRSSPHASRHALDTWRLRSHDGAAPAASRTVPMEQ